MCTIMPHAQYYQELVESIVGQQLSVKAAASIRARFLSLFDGTFPTPEQILAVSPEVLRTAGLSNAKATYVHDLARHVAAGTIRFDQLDRQQNPEIIATLTDVKGIGEWTAHMFLIFCMGRLDVLPTGDLGIRNGVKALYNLVSVPTPDEIRQVAQRHYWHPYESVASWYIWESLDNKPA